jgi:uncharacterized YigZ family protein
MLFDDTYTIPAQTGEALLKDRGSKFFAYAYPVFNDEDIKTRLEELKNQYADASHHCYAWVLNPDKSAQRANDDGEPSNTAGKPILRQIASKGLTNVLVVVVRYFGGTLLGAGGLITAYGNAAKLALDEAGIEEKLIEGSFSAVYNYDAEGDVFRFLRTLGAQILSVDKQVQGKVIFTVRKSKVEEVHNLWHDFRNFELSFIGYT